MARDFYRQCAECQSADSHPQSLHPSLHTDDDDVGITLPAKMDITRSVYLYNKPAELTKTLPSFKRFVPSYFWQRVQ